ncbi:ribosomal maturation YjgA family protein [Caulobacter endophyticus]|uniref:DUF2809 domain-containing protein n=1 Tax=Caulobacter endophyticus TaxID=2172652 RepID=A0A2T9K7V1_9CAUL|nr:DUF2809 domain-containing protein [Caulobacter endophyticus]PVM92027.1 DUF2809 domain-containing protein [Caulobacter endophyticus]
MRIRFGYLALAIALFAVEVVIALFVRDALVRPYMGDVLATAMVYFGLRGVTPLGRIGAAAGAFGLGAVVEIGQALHILDLVGLGASRWARVVFGGVFDFKDLACYAIGVALAMAVDRRQQSEPFAAR